MHQLTLSITTYNRFELTKRAYEFVVNDPRITEIVIVDDCSTDEVWEQLLTLRHEPKVKLYRQVYNRGMARNKADAVGFAKNDWVILLDSDNRIMKNYIDALPLKLEPSIIYCPDFAKPHFDFRKYANKIYDSRAAKVAIHEPMFNTMMNCCNYVVHRDSYVSTFTPEPGVKGADTITFNYRWLQRGGEFYVCPGMSYDHLVHEGSGFMADVDENMAHAEKIRNLIKQL